MAEACIRIDDISFYSFIKFFNPFILFCPDNLFIDMNIINIFGYPMNICLPVFLFLLLLLFIMNVISMMKFKGDIYTLSRKYFLYRKNIFPAHMSGVLAEFYKCLFSDKLFFILLTAVLLVYFFMPYIPDDRISEYRIYYNDYLSGVAGKYSDAKYKKLEGTMDELKESEALLKSK